MPKRGELSMQLIVMAVILLIVMVIVIAIFSGRFTSFRTEVGSCTSRGGGCTTEANCNFNQGQTSLGRLDCAETQICCAPWPAAPARQP